MWAQYLPRGSRYGGGDPKKLAKAREYNRIAVKVADHLNSEAAKLAPSEQRNVFSHSVAAVLGEDRETVRRIIMSYEGGSNGMFIYGREAGD